MKKVFLLMAAVLFGIGVQAATYGILVNNTKFFEATPLSEQDFQGRDQFKASVSLSANDVFCVYDETNDAKFTIAIEAGDGSAKANFNEGAESATCLTAGCYDFYIKLKWEDNSMWVCAGSSCTATGRDVNPGGGGGGQGGGGGTGEHTLEGFYLIGEWNGQNFGDGDDYANFIEENKFNDCKISKTFTDSDPARSACWIRAKLKMDGVTGWMFYSTDDWQGDGKQTITLYSADYLYRIGHDGNSNRWSVPTNQKLNITLKVISADEIQLTLVNDGAFASWTCSDSPGGGGETPSEIQTVSATLDLDAPMYDVLGRKVNADYKGIIIQNGHKFIR